MAFSADMKEHFVIDPLISKRQQLLLATQLCRMVLKVCIVIFCFVTYRRVSHRISLVSLLSTPSLPDSLPSVQPRLSPPSLAYPLGLISMSGKRGSETTDAQRLHACCCCLLHAANAASVVLRTFLTAGIHGHRHRSLRLHCAPETLH